MIRSVSDLDVERLSPAFSRQTLGPRPWFQTDIGSTRPWLSSHGSEGKSKPFPYLEPAALTRHSRRGERHFKKMPLDLAVFTQEQQEKAFSADTDSTKMQITGFFSNKDKAVFSSSRGRDMMLYGGEREKKARFPFSDFTTVSGGRWDTFIVQGHSTKAAAAIAPAENGHYLLFPSAVLVYIHQVVLCSDGPAYTTLSRS